MRKATSIRTYPKHKFLDNIILKFKMCHTTTNLPGHWRKSTTSSRRISCLIRAAEKNPQTHGSAVYLVQKRQSIWAEEHHPSLLSNKEVEQACFAAAGRLYEEHHGFLEALGNLVMIAMPSLQRRQLDDHWTTGQSFQTILSNLLKIGSDLNLNQIL